MDARGRREPRQARRSRDSKDDRTDGQFAISRVSDPIVPPNVTRLRSRDVPRILPTRPRTPESTPEQEEDELSQLRNEQISSLGARGQAVDALGYAAGGEESPVINTTEEEQVEKAIIKGALQMDKEKEKEQQKREHVYESPSGTLALPLIMLDSDDEPWMNVPGFTAKTDPMSELKSMTGGTDNLYLNLTPSDTEEAPNETDRVGTSITHSQAAAVLEELEKLQQEAKQERRSGTALPKFDLTTELKKVDEPLEQRNDPNQPLSPQITNAIVEPTLGTKNDTEGVTEREVTQAVTPVASGVTTLGADGGVKPQDLGNPLVPVRTRLQSDFYLPGVKKTSESITYQINDLTPEGNPALMVKLPKLQQKYGQDMYMLDLHTGYLYQIHGSSGGFQPVEERGYLHPTETLWADMNEASREEYLRVNGINHEPLQDNKSNQSKVTSTPLLLPNVSNNTHNEKVIEGLGEGEGLSPIMKEPDVPKKPPRVEEISKIETYSYTSTKDG